jgi:acyl-CoA synthetase (AMP-forming)/AMP-acid ligase II
LLVQAEARMTQRPLALRVVIFGGEALNLRALLPWFERHRDETPQLINMYGITETTVHVTYRRIRASEAQTEVESLIGVPIPDLQIHLLNDALLPVVEGEVGEIFVGGPGVARGYLNRAELTSERFLADPLSESDGRLYRSGDLARRRADGELVYLGRADRQVKINGFRIELGEVEAVLASFAGVAQVCVVAHTGAVGQRLAAYFVASGAGAEAASLSRFAEEQLPAQMRPAFYTRMDALPINGNGKIDRDALPAPQRLSVVNRGAEVVPADSREAVIATAWRSVLQVESVGLEDNFFDVGGSSLLLIALREELQDTLGTPIPVTWMFEHTTIRSLASRLEREARTQTAATPATINRAQQQRDSFARIRAMRGGSR